MARPSITLPLSTRSLRAGLRASLGLSLTGALAIGLAGAAFAAAPPSPHPRTSVPPTVGSPMGRLDDLRDDLRQIEILDINRESLDFIFRRLQFAAGLLAESRTLPERRDRTERLVLAIRALEEAQLWGEDDEGLPAYLREELLSLRQMTDDLRADPRPSRIEVALPRFAVLQRTVSEEQARLSAEYESLNERASDIFEQVFRNFRSLDAPELSAPTPTRKGKGPF